MMKRLQLDEARTLAVRFLVARGMRVVHAEMVADHLIYAHLAGHHFAGFSRLVPIARELKIRGAGGEIKVLRETPISTQYDGANIIGYATSLIAVDKAIALAKTSGIGVVGVSNSWFSGMLRYYVARAAEVGLIGIHAANSTARVAPFGGIDRKLGTNPIAFGFPADDHPLVIDFASASLMWGDIDYHRQLGKALPEGLAIASDGQPTTDPASALAGAILPWGGHRGSALSVIVQALGIFAGSDPIIAEHGQWGYLFVVIDPEVLQPLTEFKQSVKAMRDGIGASRPAPNKSAVRTPGSETTNKVLTNRARGWIEIDEAIIADLRT
jgi:L-2-hydroxycarboxylate dehydrogenase (NAD+)